MTEYIVAREEDLDGAENIVVEVEGRELGIFRIDGELYAYLNWCAHQSGPICEGELTGRRGASFDRETLEYRMDWREEETTLICPWHDWEFDVETGECLSRTGVELPSYPVRIEDGDILVSL